MDRDVVVVGAGISGLAVAWRLRSLGTRVLLLEREARVGGSIRTEREGEFLLERGPNTTSMSGMPLFNLIREVGLEPQLQAAGGAASKRFIARGGSLLPLPMSLGSFISTPVFSAAAKLRLFAEPFIASGTDPNETVAAFFCRRLGNEVAEYVIKPFVAGIYAGDAERVTIRAAFPSIYSVEREFGSVSFGFLKRSRRQRRAGVRKEKPPFARKSIAFTGGLESLPRAIGVALGDDVVTSAADIRLEESSNSGCVVRWSQQGTPTSISARRVVLASPAYASAEMIAPIAPRVAEALRAVEYAAVAIVHLGYRRSDVAHALDGFGFLVPPSERLRILGCLFSSSLFPGRAPADHVLLTTFLGGARSPDVVSLGDDELIGICRDELSSLLGLRGSPVLQSVTHIARAIPQYTAIQSSASEAVTAFEQERDSVYFCNNFRGGASIGHCVDAAEDVARRIAEKG